MPVARMNALARAHECIRPSRPGRVRAGPAERQRLLFEQLFALLRDEEIITMTKQLLTAEDLEELKQFPLLWRSYQDAHAQGARERARADIIEVLALRFDPPVSEYRQVEQMLAVIDDDARLGELHRLAVRASDLAAFLGALTDAT